MTTFKVGDKVRCIVPLNVLDLNRIYTILTVTRYSSTHSVISLEEDTNLWNSSHFMLADDTKSNEHRERKETPVTSGVLDYFPNAIREIAKVSYKGNEQHNPGQPLHWDKSKSTDHADCLVRHLLERGTIDTDGMRHTAKVAWRALALLETELEKESNAS